MMGCLGDESIAAYVDGALDLEDVARIDRHITGCASCRTQLSTVAASPVLHSYVGERIEATPSIANARVGDPVEGSMLGRYVVASVIGRGGMGVVVRARDPELERDIAIKLVAPSEQHGAWRARLRGEARAMAKLRHPNVIAVYDAGAVGDQLFVAMELVEGESLAHRLARDRTDALRVCIAAGRGLCAAHAAGLVHGDVKPDNILVDRDGRALVGDFGLSRAIAETAPGRRALVGTPAYMAPELLRGEPATPASDQFAFAVTVYEAVAGARPWRGASLDELRHAIEHELPARPRMMPRAVWRAVARGLAADPATRHRTLADLVDGLERRAPLRWAVAGVAVAAAATVAIAAQSHDTATCPDPVDRARAIALTAPCAGAACQALATGLATRAAAWRKSSVAVCVATREGRQSTDLLDRRMRCLDARLREHEALAARMIGATDRAAPYDALAALQQLAAPASCETYDGPKLAVRADQAAPVAMAEAWVAAAKVDLAMRHTGRGLDALAPHFEAIRALGVPTLVVDAAASLGQLQADAGQLDAAEATFDIGLRAAAEAGDDASTAQLLLHLAHLVGESRQQWARGAELVRAADAAVVRAGNPKRLQAALLIERGLIAEDQGDFAKAAADYTRAVELRRDDTPSELGSALQFQCDAEERIGALDLARRHCEEALAMIERALGVDHPAAAEAETNLGVAIAVQGDLAGARARWQSALARLERAVGDDAPALAKLLLNLGDVARELRDFPAAERYLTRAARVSATGDNFEVRIRIASLLRDTGKADEGIRMLEDIVRRSEAMHGLAHRTTGHALEDLAAAYYQANRMTDARSTYERAVASARALYGPRHPSTLNEEGRYGQTLMELGDAKAARPIFERVMLALEVSVKPDSPFLAEAYTNFADSLLALGEASRAAEIAAKGLAIREQLADDPLQTSEARFIAGKALWAARRDPTAIAMVRKARDEMKAVGAPATTLPEVERWLAKHRSRLYRPSTP